MLQNQQGPRPDAAGSHRTLCAADSTAVPPYMRVERARLWLLLLSLMNGWWSSSCTEPCVALPARTLFTSRVPRQSWHRRPAMVASAMQPPFALSQPVGQNALAELEGSWLRDRPVTPARAREDRRRNAQGRVQGQWEGNARPTNAGGTKIADAGCSCGLAVQL